MVKKIIKLSVFLFFVVLFISFTRDKMQELISYNKQGYDFFELLRAQFFSICQKKVAKEQIVEARLLIKICAL